MGAKIMRILREAVFALLLCVATVSSSAAAQPVAPRASSAPAAPSVAPPVVSAQVATQSGGQSEPSAAEYVIGPEDTIEVRLLASLTAPGPASIRTARCS